MHKKHEVIKKDMETHFNNTRNILTSLEIKTNFNLMLENGIYEQLISQEMRIELNNLLNQLSATSPIDKAEAPKILAKYAASIIQKKLEESTEYNTDLGTMVQIINRLIKELPDSSSELKLKKDLLDEKAEQLLEIVTFKNQIKKATNHLYIARPETSLSQSSLFTGAVHEPNLFSELKKEIISSNHIDMLVSFIKWSGLRLIIDELKTFTQSGGKLRVITTSYMGATDLKAIEELEKLLNTEIKISYDTKRTRLHAKAYVFYRNSNYSTAYIGSSNISNAALTSGLEWNIKITAKDQPETLQKINATFESYWNNPEFETFTQYSKDKLSQALKAESHTINGDTGFYKMDIKPYNYQLDILEKLAADRIVHQKFKNLIVAATGTGKTVIAAFDYKRYCNENKGATNRLLFVAHREEILYQSMYCFRMVLKDANFGELFVGDFKPAGTNHLFMSIQTFNSKNWTEQTTREYYDYIVIDEFHHAAAPSYQKLLSFYQPSILLGLTATPERMDGGDILTYFENHIAAEIRLPEAINLKLLCPFQYFGVSDIIDLSKLKWSRGGYDKSELSNVYTLNKVVADSRSRLILKAVHDYLTDIDEVKGIGFCVSIDHANYMADVFNSNNIPSIALTGNSTNEIRASAKDELIKGTIKFIFVVDLYNEGIDIPEINTILFLRPTESLTIFLQQLGRGLRNADHKECLTVLDFIGQAHQKYNYEQKFKTLLVGSRKTMQSAIQAGFPSVPTGCFIQLEKLASEYILANIKAGFGNETALIAKVISFEEDTGLKCTLENFFEFHHLSAREFYQKYTFSTLCVKAKRVSPFDLKDLKLFENAFIKISSINSRTWLQFLIKVLIDPNKIKEYILSKEQKRMIRMFQVTIWPNQVITNDLDEFWAGINLLKGCKPLYDELVQLLQYQYEKIDFVDGGHNTVDDYPLDVYCNYTRDQILVAMDFWRPNTVREGVKYLPELKTDLLFVTLNKTDKDYSPSTMYNDYSINECLFHWQSQNSISESTLTGKRYINHQEEGCKILLFVREFKKEGQSTSPYIFLGTANYLQHDGSYPMNIVWRLDKPIPAAFMKKSNKLMIG